jgi:flagellar motor protein MotB
MSPLFIITSADHGGAQQYVLTLAKAFNGSIAAGTEAAWLFDEAKKQGIHTIPVKHLKRAISPLHDLLAIYELQKIIRAEKPDIVHLNSTKAGILGSLAIPSYVTSHMSDVRASDSLSPVSAKSYKLTAKSFPLTVYTVHGFILNEPLSAPKRALYAFLERYCAKYRQHTIAVSIADKRAIITAGCGTEESVSVIPNGIAPIDFLDRKSARQQLNIADDVFAIGTIANLYKTKGLDVLINAVASLPPSNQLTNQPINYLILGEGPERKNLEKQIKKGGKSNAISNGSAKITSKGGKTIVSLGSTVNFKSGSRELTEEGKRTLDKIIKVLKNHASERIQVEGNTDNKPLPRGSKIKDNWHLSFERALTVLKYLNKGSLGKTQFVAAGLSDRNPVKPNTTDANRAANRRVDIVVMPKR